MEQERNPVIDASDVIGKLAPIFFGKSGSSSTAGVADPAVLDQSNQLFQLLSQRGVDKTAADNVIQDILYRAQLAFTPVLGEEKVAGMYNSTTKNLLAKDAINRATAASADAVFKMQQQSLDTAAQLAQTQLKATSGTKTQNKENPGVSIANLIKGAGASIGVNEAVKAAKSIFGMGVKKGSKSAKVPAGEKEAEDTVSKGAEKGVEDYFDTSQNADVDMAAFGQPGGREGEFGIGTRDSSFGASQDTLSEDAILQQILDTTPQASTASGVQVADAGAVTDASPAAAGSISGLSADTQQTIGDIGTAKALDSQVITPLLMPPAVKIDPVTGQPIPQMPPAITPEQDIGTVPAGNDAGTDLGDFGSGDAAATDASSTSATDTLDTGSFDGAGGSNAPLIAAGSHLAASDPRGAAGAYAGGIVGSYFGPVGTAVGTYVGGQVAGPVLSADEESKRDLSDEFGINEEQFTAMTQPDLAVTSPYMSEGEGITYAGDPTGITHDLFYNSDYQDAVTDIGAAGQSIDQQLFENDPVNEIISGGCFITTAATKGGELDDGFTLTKLREFRQRYMYATNERFKELQWYEQNAPKIVELINQRADADSVYAKIRNDFLVPAVIAYETGALDATYGYYRDLVDYVKQLTGVS